MMRDVKTTISRRMKSRMFELDMTIKELARICGVDRKRMSAYINMKATMRADTLAAVAETLGVSADWLLGLDNGQREKHDSGD